MEKTINVRTPRAFKIEMLVTSLVSQKELEANLLNCLVGLERRKGLVTGMSWLRTAEEK